MHPFNFDTEHVFQELSNYQSRLKQGMGSLGELKDIDVGTCKKESIYQQDKVNLYRYHADSDNKNRIPVLIVYALVNRPYMADLQQDRSLIRNLLAKGLDIYLIDWGYPDAEDSSLSIEDYIEEYLGNCVDEVRKCSGRGKINLLGICQGGVFSLCYTALHEDKVQNLITTVTPVDFHTKHDLLSKMVRHINIDLAVDSLGNVPGQYLNGIFLSLKPYQLMAKKYVDLVDILDDKNKVENFMRMEKWIFDCPDQAGETFRYFVKQFYQENGLIKGKIEIADKQVDLQNITIPVLNIFARDDHLVPPDASKALEGCVSSEDYQSVEFPGGHIGIYVSEKAKKQLPSTIYNWLSERET